MPSYFSFQLAFGGTFLSFPLKKRLISIDSIVFFLGYDLTYDKSKYCFMFCASIEKSGVEDQEHHKL